MHPHLTHGSFPAVQPNPKRLIVCCDGSWQSSVTYKKNTPSNVTRMCRTLANYGRDKHGTVWQQIIYYDAGVATGSLTSVAEALQGYLGNGLNENVIEAYNFLANNYSPGDEIFTFGFSRGAYTARAIAGLVTQIGVLQAWNMQHFPHLYGEYMQNVKGEPFKDTKEFQDYVNDPANEALKDRYQDVKIKVVGVWDTVGSLGAPDVLGWSNGGLRQKHAFHNVSLDDKIENAFHALALDEHRAPFTPTMWYLDKDKNKTTNLSQVWFPGFHLNSGGGSRRAADREQIALTTFAWMVDQVQPFLAFEDSAILSVIKQHTELVEMTPANVKAHTEAMAAAAAKNQGWGEWLSSWVVNPAKKSTEPSTIYACGRTIDSLAGMMKVTGSITRTPGQYSTTPFDPKATPPRLLSSLGFLTNEQVHPSYFIRTKHLVGQESVSMKGFDRREHPGRTTGRAWVKGTSKDVVVLPEFVIPSLPPNNGNIGLSMERELIKVGAPKELEELDRVNGLDRLGKIVNGFSGEWKSTKSWSTNGVEIHQIVEHEWHGQ